MWQSIKNIAQTAVAFLSNGKAPPNTPARLEKQMEDTNHLASKKFFIVFTSALMLFFVYYTSIFVLFFFPKEFTTHITSYVTMYSKMMDILAIIVASYLGVQTVADFAFRSTTDVKAESDNIEENRTENTNEHIIEEGTENAPEFRPYSTIETEE
jgi:hypothetical protein